ncbi:MAG: hypothetical protein KAF27_09555 [Porphyrobacter sp.]|nr:hypothetical protein [Porphyrobacter sp.]
MPDLCRETQVVPIDGFKPTLAPAALGLCLGKRNGLAPLGLGQADALVALTAALSVKAEHAFAIFEGKRASGLLGDEIELAVKARIVCVDGEQGEDRSGNGNKDGRSLQRLSGTYLSRIAAG